VLARRVVGGVGGPASYHTDRSVRVLKSKVNPNDPEFKVCVCVRVCVCVYLYGVRSVVVVLPLGGNPSFRPSDTHSWIDVVSLVPDWRAIPPLNHPHASCLGERHHHSIVSTVVCCVCVAVSWVCVSWRREMAEMVK
jgi:hypothetical protein